ncbi:unnamed protein product [Rhizophagus irregularis]|nr:unnamed protein product [Rhizophagus irregularis]
MNINGEVKFAMSKTNTFAFGADKPGNMTITNICHQRNKCCGFTFLVTRLSSIYVRKKELLKDGKKRKSGRILETQTILNINKHKHSIYTSQEGVFQVTHVGDRYCEYREVQIFYIKQQK